MKKKNLVRGNNGRFAKKPKVKMEALRTIKILDEKTGKTRTIKRRSVFDAPMPEHPNCKLSCKELLNSGRDPVTNPEHYTSHPSGVECIQITRHMTANLAAALQYMWRSAFKRGAGDLERAIWYIADEIDRVRGESDKPDAFGEYIKQAITSYYAVKPNGRG